MKPKLRACKIRRLFAKPPPLPWAKILREIQREGYCWVSYYDLMELPGGLHVATRITAELPNCHWVYSYKLEPV